LRSWPTPDSNATRERTFPSWPRLGGEGLFRTAVPLRGPPERAAEESAALARSLVTRIAHNGKDSPGGESGLTGPVEATTRVLWGMVSMSQTKGASAVRIYVRALGEVRAFWPHLAFIRFIAAA